MSSPRITLAAALVLAAALALVLVATRRVPSPSAGEASQLGGEHPAARAAPPLELPNARPVRVPDEASFPAAVAARAGETRESQTPPDAPAPAEVRGFVLDAAGSAAAGLVVVAAPLDVTRRVEPARATTDEQGAYALRDLDASLPLWIDVYPRGGKPLRHEVVLAPGEARRLDVRLAAGATVRGHVLDAAGAPIAWQRVLLVCGERPHGFGIALIAATQADGEGRFAFDGVQPGTWTLSASRPRPGDIGRPQPAPATIRVRPDDVEVEASLFTPEPLTVLGHCVDPEGDPVAGVTVSASSPFAWGSPIASDVTSADGTFVLGPLAPGDVRLETSPAPGWLAPEPLQVLAGERGVELLLRRATAGDVGASAGER